MMSNLSPNRSDIYGQPAIVYPYLQVIEYYLGILGFNYKHIFIGIFFLCINNKRLIIKTLCILAKIFNSCH